MWGIPHRRTATATTPARPAPGQGATPPGGVPPAGRTLRTRGSTRQRTCPAGTVEPRLPPFTGTTTLPRQLRNTRGPNPRPLPAREEGSGELPHTSTRTPQTAYLVRHNRHGMTFDPTLPECLHRFRTSTWCLQRGHIAVFAPRTQALQGLQVSIGNGTPPRGVVWLHGPGLALDSLITLIAAPAASDLLEERRRLV